MFHETVDLTTTYLGLDLRSPIVASASPLTRRLDTLSRIEEAGAGAVVLPSLFEEEIVGTAFLLHDRLSQGAGVFAEAASFLPELPDIAGGPDRYLELVVSAKERLSIPVIASLNGMTPGGWVQYATEIADAGADALELNVYIVAADPSDTAASVEGRLIDLVAAVRQAVRIPLAVKLSPFFSALPALARSLSRNGAGADGLVLFNRFYQPDLDLDTLSVAPTLDLSTSADLRLPMRWIGILHGAVDADLALSGGVHAPTDVVKGLLAGASVTMTTAALLTHGPSYVRALHDGLAAWLAEHDYASVSQLRGAMSRAAARDPDGYERANYLQVLRRASDRF